MSVNSWGTPFLQRELQKCHETDHQAATPHRPKLRGISIVYA
jgi:hypothetical protein